MIYVGGCPYLLESSYVVFHATLVLCSGIDLRLKAVHPLTLEQIPVYVGDYVTGGYGLGYGTKAVMGVPAHNERDLVFAQEHGLPIVKVIEEEEGDGVLVNSQWFNGMAVEQARKEIVSYAETLGVGGKMTQYALRDWLISRQRYWGAPIPILYCEKCGVSSS